MRMGGWLVFGLWLIQLGVGAALFGNLWSERLIRKYFGLSLFLAIHLVRGVIAAWLRLSDPLGYSAFWNSTNWLTIVSIVALALHALWALARPFPRPLIPALAVGSVACMIAAAVGWIISDVGLSAWNTRTASTITDLRNWSTAALMAVTVGHAIAGVLGTFSPNQRAYILGLESYFAVRLVERGLNHAAANDYEWLLAVSAAASLAMFWPLWIWFRIRQSGEATLRQIERPEDAARNLEDILRTL